MVVRNGILIVSFVSFCLSCAVSGGDNLTKKIAFIIARNILTEELERAEKDDVEYCQEYCEEIKEAIDIFNQLIQLRS